MPIMGIRRKGMFVCSECNLRYEILEDALDCHKTDIEEGYTHH